MIARVRMGHLSYFYNSRQSPHVRTAQRTRRPSSRMQPRSRVRTLAYGRHGSSSDSSSDSSHSARPRAKKTRWREKGGTSPKGLLPAIRGRPEFAQFCDTQARESARAFYRYGRNNLKASVEPNAPNRQHFMADVRKEKAPPLSFIYDLFEALPPPKRDRNIKAVGFAEPSSPNLLITHTAQIATISTAPPSHAGDGEP